MPSRPSRIYIGNLPHDTRERDIERFCDKYGRARNIFIKPGRYAFCEFEDDRDADDVVHYLHGRELLGERVVVEHSRGPARGGYDRRPGDRYGPPQRTSHRALVSNLSSRCSWQELKSIFSKVGEVTFADAHDVYSGEGVVHFTSRSDVENAIDRYDDYELYGRRIRVKRDLGSRGRSRSRSYSRSRSSSRDRRSRSPRSAYSRSRSRSPRSRTRSRSPRSRSKSRSPNNKNVDY